jgi:hypothetical protein
MLKLNFHFLDYSVIDIAVTAFYAVRQEGMSRNLNAGRENLVLLFS